MLSLVVCLVQFQNLGLKFILVKNKCLLKDLVLLVHQVIVNISILNNIIKHK